MTGRRSTATVRRWWEWVQDWYGEDYYRNAPERNPKAPRRARPA
ncbi:MAG: hypothetical protein ACE5JS_07905 [Nitrospinota bacterium]